MAYLALYLAGVGVGLAVMRDRWPVRVATALVWPLGPVAFVVVITILLVAAFILWPLPMLAAGAILGALGWWIT